MRVLHWFRKDLRLTDNTALAEAAAKGAVVVPCYVSEPALLRRPDMAGVRVAFVLRCLLALEGDIAAAGGRLLVRHGDAAAEVLRLAREVQADAVYWNAEYEPALLARDRAVLAALAAAGIPARVFADRLLVPPEAVRTREGKPYTVFTPFERACQEIAMERPRPRVAAFVRLEDVASLPFAEPERLGFHVDLTVPDGGEANARNRLRAFCSGRLWNYAKGRDLLADDFTTRLSADLKFGTLSPRQIADAAREACQEERGERRVALLESTAKLVSELRWRDFYAHVLYHFPHVEVGAFRPAFDRVEWRSDDAAFDAWLEGCTGYPIVDAGMRQLRRTGWMHNRARMIAASFLTKDLGIHWSRGERHFMKHLIDGDLASNNGGWQWAASTGTDAAPYFRVFHPVQQGRRFDPDGRYVRRWCPELASMPTERIHAPWEATPLEREAAGVRLGQDYPFPCVDHSKAREAAIARFEAVAKR